MTLAQELGLDFTKAYNAQKECGASYLSSLIWDAWISKTENPNDPPYLKSILSEGCISLEPDARLTSLTETERDRLYEQAADAMWAELQVS